MLGLAVLLTAACGGPDLARQNFPRTTVSAAAAPAVDDDAVSVANLRTVDVCGLLDSTTLGVLGTIDPVSVDSYRLGECEVGLTDAVGKKINLELDSADFLVNPSITGTIEGLPMSVDDQPGDGCTVTAVASKADSLGVSMHAGYAGGDACGAAQTALHNALRRLHTNPPRLPQPAGSLLPVDFCTVVDDATITGVLGRGSEPSAFGLHGCSWSGGAATGELQFDESTAPTAEDGRPVDLGGGVTGYQKLDTDAGKRCTVTWLHRAAGGGKGDVVTFDYNNYHDDAGNDDACGKAQTVAKAALAKLPRP